MKKIIYLALILIALTSCDKLDVGKKASVTFGSNFHVVNCISTVTIFLDDENIGTLENSVDSIVECGETDNITKEVSVGVHSYKVEIRSVNGEGCEKDITGTFVVTENECEKIFIDYYEIFTKQSDCDQNVIISKTEYENARDDPFAITGMTIDGNCLKITFSASGCDGNSWVVKLIDLGVLAYSDPAQRTLRLSLDNKEACAAVIGKEVSFNIEDLQIQNDNRVWLDISGNGILYEY